MPEITSRLSTALADRYKIERQLGEGGSELNDSRFKITDYRFEIGGGVGKSLICNLQSGFFSKLVD